MSEDKLDPNTTNWDTGVIITNSNIMVSYDTDLGFIATVMKCKTAGQVTYYNSFTGVTGVWDFEAGEGWQIAFTEIKTSGTTVPIANILWGITAKQIGK